MPRADWGGSSDYSGLFAGLAREMQNQMESLTARGARKAQEQQNADDAEKYDQWKKGLVTDEEWLAYIRTRVEQTADEPEEHQRWVETLREHTDSIADSQAEASYEAGTTSIHQLIAHYQGRKKGLRVNSPEWRDLAKRINDLSDKRDSDDIYTGAEAIIDGIDRGTHTYGDLQNFYKSKLRSVRPNSDLHNQLTRELNQVNDRLYDIGVTRKLEGAQYNFSTGKMSGSSYAALLRQEAQRYRENDPAKYYQLLAAADQAAGYGAGGYSSGGGGRGGRRRSSGGGRGRSSTLFLGSRDAVRGSGGVATPEAYGGNDPLIPVNDIMPAYSDKEILDGYFADADRIDTIWEQLEGNPSATEFYDPFSGQVIQLTPDTINALDNQYLRTMDAITAHKWANGDRDGATEATKKKTTYIYNTMMPHNTQTVERSIEQTVRTLTTRYNVAMMEPDPFVRAGYLADIAQDVEKIEERALFNATTGKSFVSRRDYIRAMRMDRGDIGESQREGEHEDVTLTMTGKGPSQGIDPLVVQELAVIRLTATALGDPGLSVQSRREMLAEATDIVLTNKFKTISEDVIDTWALGPAGSSRSDRPGGVLSTYSDQEMLINGTGVFVQRGGRIEVEEATPALVGRSDGRSVERQEPVDMHGDNPVQRTPVYMNVNGRPVQVWAEVLPEYSPRSVFLATRDFDDPFRNDDAIIQKGAYLTDSQLSNLDQATLNQWLSQGKIQRSPVVVGASVVIGNQKWVQDPDTKLWYKNSLPATLQADKFGGLKIDDEGNPVLRYKPHASAGGVPMPFDSSKVNPKQMQAIFNQMVEDGIIDPGQFMQRDANGDPLFTPIDLATIYFDPAVDLRRRNSRNRRSVIRGTDIGIEPEDDWEERANSRIKASAEAWVAENLTSKKQAMWRHNDVDPVEFAADRIRKYGEAVGLRIGGAGNRERAHVDNLRDLETGRGIPNMDALHRANRRAEADVEEASPRLRSLPRLAPVRVKPPSRMPALPDPGRSSGPSLTMPSSRTMPRTAAPMPRSQRSATPVRRRRITSQRRTTQTPSRRRVMPRGY